MSESSDEFVFELEAGLIMARLLGEDMLGPELFERLSSRGNALARGEGRSEISCDDLRVACQELEAVPAMTAAVA